MQAHVKAKNLNFVHCHVLVPKIPEPECRVDYDCSSKLACIDEQCQNPCLVSNPCISNQECVVTDTLPTRSVACICPDGMVFTDQGSCKNGTHIFNINNI